MRTVQPSTCQDRDLRLSCFRFVQLRYNSATHHRFDDADDCPNRIRFLWPKRNKLHELQQRGFAGREKKYEALLRVCVP